MVFSVASYVDAAKPALVGRITRPNFAPNAVAVYEPANNIFVADREDGRVYTFDGTSLELRNAVAVATKIRSLVVVPNTSKVYAAALDGCKIGVLDANSGALLRYLNGRYCNMFRSHMVMDAGIGKLYALSLDGLTQIDVATDSETPIPGFGGGGFEGIGLNTGTHEIYVSRYIQDTLSIVDAATLTQTTFTGPSGPGVSLAVSASSNKAFIGYCGTHPNGRAAPCIVDRATGAMQLLAAENDAVDLFYNAASKRVYSSVEVDQVASVIDGATGASVDIPMTGPHLAVGFVPAASHVYYVGQKEIVVLEERTKLKPKVLATIPIDNPTPASIVKQDIAVNHTTGRIYVLNDADALDYVTVLEDSASAKPQCQGQPATIVGTSGDDTLTGTILSAAVPVTIGSVEDPVTT
jgi:hypothetical protein